MSVEDLKTRHEEERENNPQNAHGFTQGQIGDDQRLIMIGWGGHSFKLRNWELGIRNWAFKSIIFYTIRSSKFFKDFPILGPNS